MEFDDQLDGRVVLLGATGYTGRLTAMRMVAQGRAPVLVGRDQGKLQRLIEELLPLAPSGREPDWAIADVNQRSDLLGLLRSEADVLVSTVGPFTRLGQAPVEAAIDAGAAYLDCTGEPAFVKKIFTDYDRRARRTGARLLTAFGFDYVPGNLAAGLLLERNEASAIEQVDIGYFVTGNFTLHGVSKKIVAPAKLKWMKGKGMKVATDFKVSLADYKIAGRGSIVGEKVGKVIDIQVRLKGKLQ